MSSTGNKGAGVDDWQSECAGVRERGARLLTSAQWADCSFLLGPNKTSAQAHRLILAAASPVFQDMFYGPDAQENASISVPDIEPDVFQKLLLYVYSDKIDLDNYRTAIDLHCAAQKYKLKHLLVECTAYLSRNLAPQNACVIYEFANFIGDQKLQDKSLRMIQKKTKEALSCFSFDNLALGTVIDIFSMDDLTIDSELNLLNAAERYVSTRREKHRFQQLYSNVFEKQVCYFQASENNATNASSSDNDLEGDSIVNMVENNQNNEESNSSPSDNDLGGDSIVDTVDNNQNNVDSNASPSDNDLEGDCKGVAVVVETNEADKLKCLDTEEKYDRARAEANIRYTVHSFSKLKGKTRSQTFYIRGLPWKLTVRPYYNNQQKSLAVFLHCNTHSKSVTWSCEARAEVKIIFPHDNSDLVYGKVQHLFSRRTSIKGFPYYKAWKDIQDCIKDDAITLEVHVSAEAPQGLSLDSKKYDSCADLNDVSIQALIRQIRFLTLSAKALAEYEPKTPLLAEHDILAFVMNIISEKTYLPLPEGFSTIKRPRNSTHAIARVLSNEKP